MKNSSIWLRALPLAALLAFATPAAQAGWILIPDENPEDGGTIANNPAELPWEAPYSSSPDAVGAWIQDLADLSTAPTLLDAANVPQGSGTWTLTDISGGALFLALHYGNFPGGFGLSNEYGNVAIAFQCVNDGVSCSTFSAPWRGLSNYRVYGTATAVPEPTTLALLGAGLAGVGFARRKRAQNAA